MTDSFGLQDGSLTSQVYAALLGETTWRDFLDRVAGTVPDGTAALIVHDVRTGEGHGLFSGHASEAMDHYNDYYARLNPLQPPLALKSFGEVVCDDELLARRDLARTEFFHDFLVPHGLAHSAGVRLAEVDDQSYTLIIGCGSSNPEPVRRSVRTLEGVAPHLGRAFGFYRQERTGLGRELRGVLGSLNTSNVGVVVLDSERRASVLPGTKQLALGRTSSLRISADGRVHFSSAAAQKVSQQMLRRSYAGPAVMDFYSRCTKMTLIRTEKCPERLYFEGPTVVVVMAPQDAAPACGVAQRFSRVYGLTRGELRALSGIMAGQSTDRIASEAGLSRETIRSQTKSLYAKLGVSSVAGVLRLVLQESTLHLD